MTVSTKHNTGTQLAGIWRHCWLVLIFSAPLYSQSLSDIDLHIYQLRQAIGQRLATLSQLESKPILLSQPFDSTEYALKATRHRWLSRSSYHQLVSRHHNTRNPELMFRLARHAFLHHQYHQAQQLLQQLLTLAGSQYWQGAGLYLLAAIQLKENNLLQATETFTKAAGHSNSHVRRLSQWALARLAFDRKDYQQALAIYQDLRRQQPQQLSNELELAWTELRLGKPELALHDVLLNFSIQPNANELLDAAPMLAYAFEHGQGQDSEHTINILTRVAWRLTWVELETKRALDLLTTHEDLILQELEPQLRLGRPLANIPALFHQHIAKHPRVQSYIADLLDLQSQAESLRSDLQLISLFNSNQSSGLIHPDLLALQQRINTLRQLISDSPEHQIKHSLESTELQHWQQTLQDFKREHQDLAQTLAQMQQHFAIQWPLLIGQRNQQALALKTSIFDQTKALADQAASIEALQNALTWQQQRHVSQQTQALTDALASTTPLIGYQRQWHELDQLQTQIHRTHLKISKPIPTVAQPLIDEINRNLQQVTSLTAKLRHRARQELPDILNKALVEFQHKISLYYWDIAEAQYQHYATFEKHVRHRQQKLFAEISNTRQSLADFLNSSMTPEKPTSIAIGSALVSDNVAIRIFAQEAQHFVTVAHDYALTWQQTLTQQAQAKLEQLYQHEQQAQAELNTTLFSLRAQAIDGYLKFSSLSRNLDRTPYALYRLAQLYFDSAQSIPEPGPTKPGEAPVSIDINPDVEQTYYAQATVPLQRIAREFVTFPYRDHALYLLGYTLLKTGQTEQAVEAFASLIDDYPTSPFLAEAHLRIAEHHFAQRQLVVAQRHYQGVLAQGFNYFYDKALYKLAWTHYLQGQYNSAISYFLILLDYANQLSPQQKADYVQFADEAKDYIAFSFYRSKGATTASRIFDTIGWKDYGLDILNKTEAIYTDRGQFSEAFAINSLCLKHYGQSRDLPDIFQRRIALTERLKDSGLSIAQKQAALDQLHSSSQWRQIFKNDDVALATADNLIARIQYSLATALEAQSTPQSYSTIRQLYTQVADSGDTNIETYQARYRLGELALRDRDYQTAMLHFDQTLRSQHHSHHFADSLYNMIAAQEQILLDTEQQKSKDQAAVIEDQRQRLILATDNFAKRAPKDRRLAQVLFRSGQLQAKQGNLDAASQRYLQILDLPEASPWQQDAALAAAHVYIESQQWDKAVHTSENILTKPHVNLSQQTRDQLTESYQVAVFKAAHNSPQKHMMFQQQFPQSALASKAVFNAYLLWKDAGQSKDAEQALNLLISNYPQSPEGQEALLEKAFVLDQQWQVASALEAYRNIFDQPHLTPSHRSQALRNYVSLLTLGKVEPQSIEKLRAIFRNDNYADNNEIRALLAAQLPSDDPHRSLLWQDILSDQTANEQQRALALLSLAHAPQLTQAQAVSFMQQAQRKIANNPTLLENSNIALAYVRAKRSQTLHSQQKLDQALVRSDSPKQLEKSFRNKNKLLMEFEKHALDWITGSDPVMQVEALGLLSQQYHQTYQQLTELQPPKALALEHQQGFRQQLATLAEPFARKAQEAAEKQQELARTHFVPLTGTTIIADNWPQAPHLWLPQLPDFWMPQPEQDPHLTLHTSQYFQKAASLWPQLWKPQARQQAQQALANILATAPQSPHAVFNQAVIEIINGDVPATMTSIQLLSTIAPRERTIALEILRYLSQREFEACQTLLPTLLDSPLQSWATSINVLLHILQNRHQQAVSLGHAAYQINNQLFAKIFAQSLISMGEVRQARIIAQRNLIKRQDPGLLFALALTFIQKEDKGVQLALHNEAANQGSPEAMLYLSSLAKAAGNVLGSQQLGQKASQHAGVFMRLPFVNFDLPWSDLTQSFDSLEPSKHLTSSETQ